MEKKHFVSLDSRTDLSVSAVDYVISFDEDLVSLAVGDSTLVISGEELTIKTLSLDSGEISIEGRVDSLTYSDAVPKKKRFSLFNRDNG